MENVTLLGKAENYVSNLFLNSNTAGLFYHNYNHTLSVIEGIKTAAKSLQLPNKNTELLLLSAWFHDIGYLYTRTEHEAKSIEIIQNALRPNYINFIEAASTCIAATKIGEIPENYLAALLKDIDVAFGSAYDFDQTNQAYREELIVSEDRHFSDEKWREMSLNFLRNIKFYSDYGKANFKPLVKKNLESYSNKQLQLK